MSIAVIKSIEPILKANDVEFAGIFGSYARGEEHEGSDVDVLVRFKKAKSLLDIVALEMELSEHIHRKVDLVTERGLCAHIKDRVFRDLRTIYGER